MSLLVDYPICQEVDELKGQIRIEKKMGTGHRVLNRTHEAFPCSSRSHKPVDSNKGQYRRDIKIGFFFVHDDDIIGCHFVLGRHPCGSDLAV